MKSTLRRNCRSSGAMFMNGPMLSLSLASTTGWMYLPAAFAQRSSLDAERPLEVRAPLDAGAVGDDGDHELAPSTFFFIAASLLSSACTSSQMLNPISRSL